MDATYWKELFRNWPAEVERRGVLVTAFDEQVPFDGFSSSESLLLVDRRTPDTIGARKVIVPWSQIVAVKIVDVVKLNVFSPLGFVEPPAVAKKPS